MNLAARKLKPTDPIVLHVAECSPCLRELKEFQKQLKRQLLLKTAGALAAMLIVIVAAVLVWKGSRQPAPEQTVTLDFRPFAVTRGVEEKPTPPVPTLPRGRLNLTITLPVASPDGPYEFRVLNDAQRPALSGTVQATMRDHQTVISTKLDTSGLARGEYSFWLREQGNDLGTPYPLEVR